MTPTADVPSGGNHIIDGNLVSEAFQYPAGLVDSLASSFWQSGMFLRQPMVSLRGNIVSGGTHAGFTFRIQDQKDTYHRPEMALIGTRRLTLGLYDWNATVNMTLALCTRRCLRDKKCLAVSFCDPFDEGCENSCVLSSIRPGCGGRMCDEGEFCDSIFSSVCQNCSRFTTAADCDEDVNVVTASDCKTSCFPPPTTAIYTSYQKVRSHSIMDNEAYGSQKYGAVIRNQAGNRELFRFKAWLNSRAGIVDFDETQSVQLREVVLSDNYMGTICCRLL